MGVSLTSPKCISARHAKKHAANYAFRKRKSALLAIRAWRGLSWRYNGTKPKDFTSGLGLTGGSIIDRYYRVEATN